MRDHQSTNAEAVMVKQKARKRAAWIGSDKASWLFSATLACLPALLGVTPARGAAEDPQMVSALEVVRDALPKLGACRSGQPKDITKGDITFRCRVSGEWWADIPVSSLGQCQRLLSLDLPPQIQSIVTFPSDDAPSSPDLSQNIAGGGIEWFHAVGPLAFCAPRSGDGSLPAKVRLVVRPIEEPTS